jgi:Cu/Ag efflux protein CusF
MSKFIKVVGVGLLMASFSVVAEDYAGEGTVNAVKTKEKKLTISHGPIKGLMDGMTMDFAVMDPAMLDDVKQGSKIKFTLTKEKDGKLVISDLQPVGQ